MRLFFFDVLKWVCRETISFVKSEVIGHVFNACQILLTLNIFWTLQSPDINRKIYNTTRDSWGFLLFRSRLVYPTVINVTKLSAKETNLYQFFCSAELLNFLFLTLGYFYFSLPHVTFWSQRGVEFYNLTDFIRIWCLRILDELFNQKNY